MGHSDHEKVGRSTLGPRSRGPGMRPLVVVAVLSIMAVVPGLWAQTTATIQGTVNSRLRSATDFGIYMTPALFAGGIHHIGIHRVHHHIIHTCILTDLQNFLPVFTAIEALI